jgi:excisionase family DNA binding protein
MATSSLKRREDMVSDGLVSVKEACNFLGISNTFIYDMMKSGELKYVKLGRARRVPRSELRRVASEGLCGQVA